jgi:hypothetical protein
MCFIIRRYIFRESACAFLVGSVPCFVIATFDGVEQVLLAIQALNPSAALFTYFVALVLLPLTLSWLNMRFIDNNISHPGPIARWKEVAREASTSLHGIYRSAAGFSAVAMVPVLCVEPSALSLLMTSVMLLFSASCLLMCCVLSSWHRA